MTTRPTLEQFVQDTLTVNNLAGDVKEIIGKIVEIARERAVNCVGGSVAYIDPEEVREMVINNAELSAKLAEEKQAKAEERAKKHEEERRLREEEKKAKALENEKKVAGGEQISLFG